MKYSKTTLMELSHKYSSILRKCALLNATILVGTMLTLPVMAAEESDTPIDLSNKATPTQVEGVHIFGQTTVHAVSVSNSILTMEDSTLDNNSKFQGGAISNVGGSTLTLLGTLSEDNTSTFTISQNAYP